MIKPAIYERGVPDKMREILFRGKDAMGAWHIGLLANVGNVWYISNDAGVSTAFEVIPNTVGQYTGLTDMNGTKIFEGDILKLEKCTEFGVMKWAKRNAAFVVVDDKSHGHAYAYNMFTTCFEVIGNIYDNPELWEDIKT